MSDPHLFIKYSLQEAGLLLLGAVYAARLIWLHTRFRSATDRQPMNERRGAGPLRGGVYSLGVLGMPWHLESARKHPFVYAQFIALHMGIAAALVLSFILPYAPGWLSIPPFTGVVTATIAIGILAAFLRLHRRITAPFLRAVNTVDDYLSLGLLTVWLSLALLSVTTRGADTPIQSAFFLLTAFFLFYVPFSKISHYLYYPFARYLLGRTLGWRGVYPLARVPIAQPKRSQRPR